MLKRRLSVLTVAALIFSTPVAPALAQNTGAEGIATAAAVGAVKPGAQAGAGLKDEMLKLIAEAKAGRAVPPSPPRQQRPVQKNGLSKGQKIAIGVGAVAAAIIVVIVMSRGDDSDRFNAPPCPPGQLCL